MIPFLRFLVAGGGRVALAAAVPLVGAAVVAVGLQVQPVRFLEQIAHALAGDSPAPSATAALFACCVGLALWAAPRVALGDRGWIRHLPVSRFHRRLALAAGLAYAQAPLLIGALCCAVLESWRSGRPAWRGFIIPPLVTLAAAAAVAGVRREQGLRRPAVPAHALWPLPARIAWRAVGTRAAFAWLAGAIPLGAAFLFSRNNAPLGAGVGTAARLGGGLAVTLTVAVIAQELATRRPPWPWARSLPGSAMGRVVEDACLLVASCLPPLAALAALDAGAVIAVSASTPLLALRAAATMRPTGATRPSTSNSFVLEGGLGSALLALAPWLAIGAILALPIALHAAAARDRALKVARWDPLRHDAAGDTASWTA